MMKIVRTSLLLLLFLPVLLHSQSGQHTQMLAGGMMGLGVRWQQGTITIGDGSYECCRFTDGNGLGLTGGMRILYALNDVSTLRGGVAWERVVSEYDASRKNHPILGRGNRVEYVSLQEDLKIRFSGISVELGFVYRLYRPGMYVAVIPTITIPTTVEWKSTETITAPEGVRYLDGSRSKVLIDEPMPDLNSYFSLRFGTGALFPITEDLMLNPEMLFAIPVTNAHSVYSWSMSGFDLTLGLLYRI
ncbi:MAG: hypothetical protein KFH87_11075 [Bacteroidetes bacterium]|nr:hypothetical protein [Bacteroidota bacterium]